MSKPGRGMSKDELLSLASRPEGFSVHVYRWGHYNLRRQCRRYLKAGLLTVTRHRNSLVYFRVRGGHEQ